VAGESVQELLAKLTGAAGENPEDIYATWASLTVRGGEPLEQLVRRHLVAGGKSAQVRESLLATLRAGGAVGETVEECLLKSGLTGWS
jgi:hypothetical protein